jgi:hypothetical protein
MNSSKARRGLLVTVDVDSNKVTISLDDVHRSAGDEVWTTKEHVTHKPVGLKEFKEMTLSDSELADFAGYILARLNAYIELEEN